MVCGAVCLDTQTDTSNCGACAAVECSDQRKRVLPGQPSQSYVIDKLMNVDICFGTQMPKLGAVPSAQITTIANWICEGAPNN